MADPVLLSETQEHVRVLRLNRPARKNALDARLGWALVRSVEEAAADDALRLLAITGEGDAFCSGIDLVGGDSGDEAPPTPQDEMLGYCTRHAAVAPLAARQTKRMLGRSQAPANLEGHLREELRYARRGLASEDGKEAVAAILEKRPPIFRGR